MFIKQLSNFLKPVVKMKFSKNHIPRFTSHSLNHSPAKSYAMSGVWLGFLKSLYILIFCRSVKIERILTSFSSAFLAEKNFLKRQYASLLLLLATRKHYQQTTLFSAVYTRRPRDRVSVTDR